MNKRSRASGVSTTEISFLGDILALAPLAPRMVGGGRGGGGKGGGPHSRPQQRQIKSSNGKAVRWLRGADVYRQACARLGQLPAPEIYSDLSAHGALVVDLQLRLVGWLCF